MHTRHLLRLTAPRACPTTPSPSSLNKLPGRPVSTPLLPVSLSAAVAPFSTSQNRKLRNQIYTSVRKPDDFYTYQQISSSSRTPLLTLWTTSWCSTCRVVAPLLQSLVESGVGEAEGGVAFCTVEYDSPDIMSAGFGMTYMITSVPTLLSFDAQEAQVQTKVQDARKMADRQFLEDWIRNEARRHGGRGGGSGGSGPDGKGPFGGLFGNWK
ncbi:hypothetical protein D7B24_005041 [Verticillium nonalfalfae]|uniref:Thioredoxin domain-containing protein n=1 Tax=Verticillium nonalfalfae TaxID=1051616 RepID=A0A3M9YK31_9PEZI|nr:uncharacterized protein D7B24_005041 [Verticillium nonalfalfae]RNJ60953.1 hypothetical protein D7B24_005041 [Verticillium nonalfalfae]